MSKKKTSARVDPINLPRRLREELQAASDFLAHQQPQEALDVLIELDHKYPHNADVLGLMANAFSTLGSTDGFLLAMIQLHDLTPNRPELQLGLAGAYLETNNIALGLRTLRQYLNRWPRDEHSSEIQQTVSALEPALAQILSDIGFTLEDGLDFACKHEELQINMNQGNFGRCKQLAKVLLNQRPNFTPVLNNLSQIAWLEGDLAGAIEASQKVLVVDPENIHALSNLTRFHAMRAEKETSLDYARRLKESSTPATDSWLKKAEAFSFIGDDASVLALIGGATQAGEFDEFDAWVWHWCAVAEYRQGNLEMAHTYWQNGLKSMPYFPLATDNLEELDKPEYERVSPQAFDLAAWLPQRTIDAFTQEVDRFGREKEEQVFRARLNTFLDKHPEILNFIPQALAFGDAQSRSVAIEITDMTAHPVALEHLKNFALGQAGPDELRMKAAQIVSNHGMLPSGQPINIWTQGAWHPIAMLGFTVTHEELENPPLVPAAMRLMEQAIDALQGLNGAKAEGLLRKALEIQPDEPGLLNNLAISLKMQDKTSEANALVDRVAEEFPDYFFGQIISVQKAIQEKDLEKAKAILDKLIQKEKLRITEFSAVCACHIDLMIAENNPEGAVSWFRLWKQGAPDDPLLAQYADSIEKIQVYLTNRGSSTQKIGPITR